MAWNPIRWDDVQPRHLIILAAASFVLALTPLLLEPLGYLLLQVSPLLVYLTTSTFILLGITLLVAAAWVREGHPGGLATLVWGPLFLYLALGIAFFTLLTKLFGFYHPSNTVVVAFWPFFALWHLGCPWAPWGCP